jgi:putative ABC transport system permease protein
LAADAPLQVYRPLAQRPPAFATLMVRTSVPPLTLGHAVQAALSGADPDTPVSDIATMDSVVSKSVTQPRLHFLVFGLFAGLALLLASIGLYGLIAYSVAQRVREFGIRTALGAAPRSILALVLREGAILIALGIALGLAGSLASARLLQGLLFATSPHDPAIYFGAPLILAAVTLLACLLPARRATRVDPIIALRSE